MRDGAHQSETLEGRNFIAPTGAQREPRQAPLERARPQGRRLALKEEQERARRTRLEQVLRRAPAAAWDAVAQTTVPTPMRL